jgi:hypothetical protein
VLNILKAFAWMRWRIFVNTLNKASGRDAVQRTSLALDRLAPILLIAILIPSAIGLGAAGVFIGFQLVRAPGQTVWFQLPRVLLFGGLLAAIIGPALMPSGDRTNPVRLLLLPIPARTLYVSHVAGALSDPWVFLQMPLLAGLPIGMLAAGAPRAAAIALIAGALFALLLIGLAAGVTTLIHLALRDRRRGEIIALVLIVFLPMIGFLPSILRAERRTGERPPDWVMTIGRRVLSAAPSELYITSLRAASQGATRSTLPRIGAIAAVTMGVHVTGLALFRRAMWSSGSGGRRRASSMQHVWARVIPFVSPGTSAVALALVRLAARTPRGRATLLTPVALTALFTMVIWRRGLLEIGPFSASNGLGFAAFVSFLALIASLPISMNQFAVDRAGLTLTLLSPLNARQILAGKALGTGLMTIFPAIICIVLTAIAFPGGSLALWAALVPALCATYTLAAPIALMLSTIFPRVVNMNSVGSSSNAHAVAGFAGLFVFGLAALPPAALALVAIGIFDRPLLALVFILAWCPVAFAVARLLLRPAERIFERRRENLAMLM